MVEDLPAAVQRVKPWSSHCGGKLCDRGGQVSFVNRARPTNKILRLLGAGILLGIRVNSCPFAVHSVQFLDLLERGFEVGEAGF